MVAVIKSWKGEERLSVVFWIYFVIGQVVIALLLSSLSKVSQDMGASYMRLIFTMAFVVPYMVWTTWSVWRCAFNVSWAPWGYVARLLILILVIEKVYRAMV